MQRFTLLLFAIIAAALLLCRYKVKLCDLLFFNCLSCIVWSSTFWKELNIKGIEEKERWRIISGGGRLEREREDDRVEWSWLISSHGPVCVEGGGLSWEVFSPLGSDPDSAVKPKPYIIRPWLNPIMSVCVGVCWTGTPKGSRGVCVTESIRDVCVITTVVVVTEGDSTQKIPPTCRSDLYV